jgi:plasmid maintenance system killer protein
MCWVRIPNFAHKGLKKLYEDDVARGVPPDSVDKLRKMLAFLDDMEEAEELRALPSCEGACFDRRPERYMEPQRYSEQKTHVSHQYGRTRNL